jgi:hypothetical protein
MTTVPIQSVVHRRWATPSLEMVNVFSEAIEKVNEPPYRNLQVLLRVDAWVLNADFRKAVWIDLHVFDERDQVIAAKTLPFRYFEPAGGGGDFFEFNDVIYQGASAGPGWVSFAPDARKVQYRLYYEVLGNLYSDGLLRQQDLVSDPDVVQQTDTGGSALNQPLVMAGLHG